MRNPAAPSIAARSRTHRRRRGSGTYLTPDQGGPMQLPSHRTHPANHRPAGASPGRRRRRARILIGTVALMCVISATLGGALAYANGQTVRGGVKNPTFGGFFGTTQIWANNSTWGTRQSNLGSGGSAIYGCRSLKGGLPCLDADNLKGGPAFEFITTGAVGGSILVASSSAAPFTTNGH